ncbi:MAG: hypothetical protein MUE60_05465 [Candidatus Eisenbacteria bacterium]|jgi:tRNA (guanine-N7-)-methyltransferase|nr:hypothetical protein [Candidatus Eisenbacteria bacterium]
MTTTALARERLLDDCPLPRLLCDDAAGSAAAWRSLLGTVEGVEIEVGCGRGVFLAAEALRRPRLGFLGIESSPKWARLAASALARQGIANAAVVQAEALSFLRTRVSEASVEALHVYFPDPWPRTRHEKRRIWRPDFVGEVLRVLAPGGKIITATDIRGYFIAIQRMLTAHACLQQRELPEAWPVTAYARKFLDRGRPVFSTLFVKHAGPPDQESHGA